MNTADKDTGSMEEKSLNLFGSLSLLQYWYYCILNSFSSVGFKVGQVTGTLPVFSGDSSTPGTLSLCS